MRKWIWHNHAKEHFELTGSPSFSGAGKFGAFPYGVGAGGGSNEEGDGCGDAGGLGVDHSIAAQLVAAMAVERKP